MTHGFIVSRSQVCYKQFALVINKQTESSIWPCGSAVEMDGGPCVWRCHGLMLKVGAGKEAKSLVSIFKLPTSSSTQNRKETWKVRTNGHVERKPDIDFDPGSSTSVRKENGRSFPAFTVEVAPPVRPAPLQEATCAKEERSQCPVLNMSLEVGAQACVTPGRAPLPAGFRPGVSSWLVPLRSGKEAR